MAIVFRDEQGSDLTPAQVDNNFREINTRLTAVETTPPPTNDIVNITQSASGSQITIYLRDGSYYTASLPVAVIFFRGDWISGDAYFRNNLVKRGRRLYLILQDHVAADEFDELATDGSDNELYSLVFEPTNPVPVDVEETEITLDVEYFDSYLRCLDGCLVTIADEDDIAIPVGTEISFRQCSDGGITVVWNDAVITVNVIEGYEASTDRQGAVFTLKKVGSNIWDCFGLLAVEGASVDDSTS